MGSLWLSDKASRVDTDSQMRKSGGFGSIAPNPTSVSTGVNGAGKMRIASEPALAAVGEREQYLRNNGDDNKIHINRHTCF